MTAEHTKVEVRRNLAPRLGAAQRTGAPALRIIAFDVRLAQAARSLGWTVARRLSAETLSHLR